VRTTPYRLLFAVVLSTSRAPAQSTPQPNLALEWRAPEGCPDGAAISDRVRSLLASSDTSTDPVQARGIVIPPVAGGAWQLTLETVQGARTWQRSLSAGSCDELADAGALIIALVIDPNLRPEAATTAEAPPPADVPALAPTATLPAAQAAAPTHDLMSERPPTRAESETTVHITASALVDSGTLPRAALGGELTGGLGFGPVEVQALGTVLPEAREVVAQEPARGGDISLLAGGLRGCYVIEGPELAGLACGGLEAGRIQGSGVGTMTTDTQSVFWLAGRLGVVGRYRLGGPTAAQLGLEALIPVTRPEFVLENVGSVHRPAVATARASLGLELHFQ